MSFRRPDVWLVWPRYHRWRARLRLASRHRPAAGPGGPLHRRKAARRSKGHRRRAAGDPHYYSSSVEI